MQHLRGSYTAFPRVQSEQGNVVSLRLLKAYSARGSRPNPLQAMRFNLLFKHLTDKLFPHELHFGRVALREVLSKLKVISSDWSDSDEKLISDFWQVLSQCE